jgi:predicted GIY-YIG superfamily endonuclease
MQITTKNVEVRKSIHTSMGADFTKFQGVLRFALQILPADNLKGFKMQPTTKSWHQKHKEQTVELQDVHSPLQLLNYKNLLSQNKTDHIQRNWLHCLSKMQRRKRYGKL